MKKLGLVICAVVMIMALSSCVTSHYEYQESGSTLGFTQLAVKDYEIIDLITVTTTVTEKVSFASLDKSIDGSEIVYPLLLEEAKKLGGHDVINVRIAKKEDSVDKGFFGKEATYTYTATGVAIKYTNKNLETKAIYDANGNLTEVTGPVLEQNVTTVSKSSFFDKINIFKIFKN